MVLPAIAAVRAASAAGTMGATALGLSIGHTDLELTRDLFKLQMQQAKRLWTAGWAENSVRHGESCSQSAQQHAEAQALARASYYQAEKLQSQSLKLARDQDSRAYEMSWRAEVRESLRDELSNKYNQYNTVMLCDTVCLSCVFGLVAQANIPAAAPAFMINVYVFCMGASVACFVLSLMFSVVVIRRLHEHTAAILERKLFARADLATFWSDEKVAQPTGPQELYLLHQAYEKWAYQYLEPYGASSVHLMATGVILMFVTAGLLTHNLYRIEYSQAHWAVPLFWVSVIATVGTILLLKQSEDRLEKKKQGVYDNAPWQDDDMLDSSSSAMNPFTKITRAAKEIHNYQADAIANAERVSRMDRLAQREWQQQHRATSALNAHVAKHRSETTQKAVKIRQEILQLLTTAAEELDALPEGLTAQLNKLLHKIGEADSRTAELVTTDDKEEVGCEEKDDIEEVFIRPRKKPSSSDHRRPSSPLDDSLDATNTCHITSSAKRSWCSPSMDAQRIPVSLGALRRKLGESPVTTLLRFRNTSDEPLRLRSGLKLEEGKYFQNLKVDHGVDAEESSGVVHALYPASEIPAHSEVVLAARNSGSNWVPTSGVAGELVYTNRDETWVFKVQFTNPILVNRRPRQCRVAATRSRRHLCDTNFDQKHEQFWTIERKEMDVKSNSETVIIVSLHKGEEGRTAELRHRRCQRKLQTGCLLVHRQDIGLGFQWHRRWFELTPSLFIQFESRYDSRSESDIALQDIGAVHRAADSMYPNIFEIHMLVPKGAIYRYSATSPSERDAWVHHIRKALGLNNLTIHSSTSASKGDDQSAIESGVECIQTDSGTILPNV